MEKWSTLSTRYNILLLLITFATYAYRDLWPLATYTQQPKDIHEGWLLWIKIATLFATAVVIPLFIPRRYIPVDPKVRVLRSYYTIMYSNFPGTYAHDK